MARAYVDKDNIVWVDDKKVLTLLGAFTYSCLDHPLLHNSDKTEYLGLLFEEKRDPRMPAKECAVVQKRFEKYDSEEAIYSIFEDLRLQGYKDRIPDLRAENFVLE